MNKVMTMMSPLRIALEVVFQSRNDTAQLVHSYMMPEKPKVNYDTNSVEDTDKIASTSGIELARMKARIQKPVLMRIRISQVRIVLR